MHSVRPRSHATTRLARIVRAIERLDGEPALTEKHAPLINRVMHDLMVAYRSRGHDVGCDDGGTAYALPRSKTVGLVHELTDLAAKVRKAVAGKISLREWTTIWAAEPHRIRKLWKPKLIKTPEGRIIDRGTIAMSFGAPGYGIVVPKPEVVLPVIEAALAKITASPRSKKRERDMDEAKAVAAIRAAYREITGHTGGRVIDKGNLAGRFVALGRDIDGIFGTALFAAKDSVRFRR